MDLEGRTGRAMSDRERRKAQRKEERLALNPNPKALTLDPNCNPTILTRIHPPVYP
jgi:hypothetical protein